MDSTEHRVPSSLSHPDPISNALANLLGEVRRHGEQLDGQGKKLDEVLVEVRGTRTEPGHSEQLRDHEKRIKALEGWRMWAVGIGTSILTAIGTALALGQATGGKP